MGINDIGDKPVQNANQLMEERLEELKLGPDSDPTTIKGGKKYRKHHSKKHRSRKHYTRKHNKSKKMNYLTFCKKYAQQHGLPNARAAMSNPNCKRAFHAMKH